MSGPDDRRRPAPGVGLNAGSRLDESSMPRSATARKLAADLRLLALRMLRDQLGDLVMVIARAVDRIERGEP